MAQYYDNNKITFQQLIMGQIKMIQVICSKELRDGEKIIKNLLGEQTIEGEDTRHSFLQSVEMFGSLLFPYFSTQMIKNFDKFCDIYDMELIDALDDKEFQKNLRKLFKLDPKKDIKDEINKQEKYMVQANIYFLNYKIKQGRRIFRALVKLFKDNDFLGSEGYTDSEPTEGSMEMTDDGTDDFSLKDEDQTPIEEPGINKLE